MTTAANGKKKKPPTSTPPATEGYKILKALERIEERFIDLEKLMRSHWGEHK